MTCETKRQYLLILHSSGILCNSNSDKSAAVVGPCMGPSMETSTPDQWKSDSACHMTGSANHHSHSVVIHIPGRIAHLCLFVLLNYQNFIFFELEIAYEIYSFKWRKICQFKRKIHFSLCQFRLSSFMQSLLNSPLLCINHLIFILARDNNIVSFVCFKYCSRSFQKQSNVNSIITCITYFISPNLCGMKPSSVSCVKSKAWVSSCRDYHNVCNQIKGFIFYAINLQ